MSKGRRIERWGPDDEAFWERIHLRPAGACARVPSLAEAAV